MQLTNLVVLPYQLVRRPLDAVDRYAVSRLSPQNPIRSTYRDVLGAADTLMALLVGAPGLVDAPAAEPDFTAEDVDPAPAESTTKADEQRRKDFAQKEEQVTRANHSPAAIGRDLARMRAVVEAREHEGTE
jgi:hypothetical protein